MTSKGHTRGSGGGSYGGSSQGAQEFVGQSSPRSTPRSRHPQHSTSSSSYLNTPSNLYRNSRSLDSGLDEFGAVPFTASPSPQTRMGHVPRTQAEATQV